MKNQNKIISLLMPAYNEEEVLPYFLKELDILAAKLRENYTLQFLFINDGSKDNTLNILTKEKNKIPEIEVVSLSRNFGKEACIKAGFRYAYGDAAILLDCDLEDPLELIFDMITEWEKGFHVVYSVRKKRKESIIKRLTAFMFYKVINIFSSIRIYENSSDFRLFDKKVIKQLRRLNERNRFSKGLFNWVGFKSTPVYYDRIERKHGVTKWNYLKLFNYALDGIFSFSNTPLRIVTILGSLISLSSFLYGCFIVLNVVLTGIDVPGYASLLTIILFTNGCVILSIGIIGEYIGRIFIETKHRPSYIIEKLIGEKLGK